jgi:SAM-dependent methyltransferase
MAAFSDSSFKADDYNSFRPTYTNEVFHEIVKYHTGEHDLAVDIGCGSGQASYPLTEYFKHVIGTDLSHAMINTANNRITEEYKDRIKFVQSPAETLEFLDDSSVDLVTAAQCIHWFDHPKFFKEIHRVLKPNGTIAFWGYADPIFNVAEADAMSEQFTYDDPAKLGPYWEQPGRQILRDLLKDVNAPEPQFTELKTYEHIPGVSDGKSPLQIRREVPLEFYGKYVKTWSSYHNWEKAHRGEPDIADQYIRELQARLKWTPKTRVTLEWLTVLKLARKRL